jgi:hypothetical protein
VLISKLKTTEWGLSELEQWQLEIIQAERQRVKKVKTIQINRHTQTRIKHPRTMGSIKVSVIGVLSWRQDLDRGKCLKVSLLIDIKI